VQPRIFHCDRLVKSEALNHHGTLFAGRSAEWFVKAGFIAAASVLPAKNIVCVKIHGLTFTKPIRAGEIARFESKMIKTGRSSLTVHVQLIVETTETPILKGFITFVHVDGRCQRLYAHYLSIQRAFVHLSLDTQKSEKNSDKNIHLQNINATILMMSS